MKKKTIKIKVNLDKALGSAHRNEYLEDNPHGFKRVRKVHKNKRKYNRKRLKNIIS